MNWKNTFNFQGKTFYYNRIKFNNWGERAVEIPIAFNFLANLKKKNNLLEVGHVLSHYENSLSEYMGIKPRRIVDKFEVDTGVDNIDLMEIPSEEKYDAIVSISTVEHIGQSTEPYSASYGEQVEERDLEGPLKAIAKIYDLLVRGGKALITVPFGKLIDGEWYIQFSQGYLDLLVSKYKIPEDAISTSFMRRVGVEIPGENPPQVWEEVGETTFINHLEYNWPWPCASAIAVIEMTKLTDRFSLNLDIPATPLCYNSPLLYDRRTVYLELTEPNFRDILEKTRDINLIFFPDWCQPEESVYSELKKVVRSVLNHQNKSGVTLLVDCSNFSEEDGNLMLAGVTMDILLKENL